MLWGTQMNERLEILAMALVLGILVLIVSHLRL